jgi:hypothetical protein
MVVLMGGHNVKFSVNLDDKLSTPAVQQKFLNILEDKMRAQGIPITPLELQVLVFEDGVIQWKRWSALTILDNTMIVGYMCHRFIIPAYISIGNGWTPEMIETHKAITIKFNALKQHPEHADRDGRERREDYGRRDRSQARGRASRDYSPRSRSTPTYTSRSRRDYEDDYPSFPEDDDDYRGPSSRSHSNRDY